MFDNTRKMVGENGEMVEHRGHYFEKEHDMEPDSHGDSDGIWNKVFVVTFHGTFFSIWLYLNEFLRYDLHFWLIWEHMTHRIP